MPGLAWGLTIGGIALIFVVDFLILGRGARIVGMREAGVTAGAYVLLATLFGVGVWIFAGSQYGAEFFAGHVTELSLSVDNLFVFSVILASFAVPREYQLKVLQFGIIGALILRFAFILVGAAALSYFTWLFFVFGAFLLPDRLEAGHQPRDRVRSRGQQDHALRGEGAADHNAVRRRSLHDEGWPSNDSATNFAALEACTCPSTTPRTSRRRSATPASGRTTSTCWSPPTSRGSSVSGTRESAASRSRSKLAVYTAAAGIHPRRVLPVVLDMGTDNLKLLNDEMYLGARHPRVRDERYDILIDAYVTACTKLFPHAMLHWEDFGATNARRILNKYADQVCTFNDDMQGTAAVVLAAVL